MKTLSRMQPEEEKIREQPRRCSGEIQQLTSKTRPNLRPGEQSRDERASHAIAPSSCSNSTEDGYQDSKCDKNPDHPSKTFQSIQLSTIDENILCVAVKPSSECCRDTSCTSSPEYPSNQQESYMRSNAAENPRWQDEEKEHV